MDCSQYLWCLVGVQILPLQGKKNTELALTLEQTVKLIFTSGHNTLAVAFKGASVILGLYKGRIYLKHDVVIKKELLGHSY